MWAGAVQAQATLAAWEGTDLSSLRLCVCQGSLLGLFPHPLPTPLLQTGA